MNTEQKRLQVIAQCNAINHMATVLAKVHADIAVLLEKTDAGPFLDITGARTAEIMEELGNTLNGMDAADSADAWMDVIFERAHEMWPVAALAASPAPTLSDAEIDRINELAEQATRAWRDSNVGPYSVKAEQRYYWRQVMNLVSHVAAPQPEAAQPASTVRTLIESAWCAGYYHAGYTHDSAYAEQEASKFADEVLAAQPAPMPDQAGFEAWAKGEGLDRTLANGAYCEDFRFPATYYSRDTETAWRAWANKPAAAPSQTAPTAQSEQRSITSSEVVALATKYGVDSKGTVAQFNWLQLIEFAGDIVKLSRASLSSNTPVEQTELPPLQPIGTIYAGNYWQPINSKASKPDNGIAIAEVVSVGQAKEYARQAIASQAEQTKPQPLTDGEIQFRFFKNLSAEQRLAVFRVFGVYPDDCTESLNHGIERRLLKRILEARTAQPAQEGETN